MWAIKKLNFNFKEASDKRLLQLSGLEEMRNDSYDNAKIYKDKTKKLHDKQLLRKEFKKGDEVLIFNSRLKFFSGKLRSHLLGPIIVTLVTPCGVVCLKSDNGREFKVNGPRMKHYHGEKAMKKVIYHLGG